MRKTPFVVAAVAAVAAALLYAIAVHRGKEVEAIGDCGNAAVIAARTAAFARGAVAAMAIDKSPRPAVNLTFEGADGKPMHLADFHGKTVLLNVWATWCVPCRAEMPALDKLQAALGGPDFQVVAVNIDTARLERRKPFLESVGVKHLSFFADPKAEVFQVLKRAGKIVGLPTTMLIDPKGCEIGLMAGGAHWDSPDAQKLIEAALGR